MGQQPKEAWRKMFFEPLEGERDNCSGTSAFYLFVVD
jgi:hypothetical protein